MLGEGGAGVEGLSVGPGDDGAVLEVEGSLVLSADLSIEDVHFRREWLSFPEIGYRAAAAALSDLAAMAAEPIGVMVSLALPKAEAWDVGPAIQEGVREACALCGATILGGDLASSPGPIVLDVVVVGRTDRPVTRAGARPGDMLWVTGALGGAAGAVRAWKEGNEPSAGLRASYARPTPRIAEGLWLGKEAEVSAMIDLSDGLGGDAGHLAAASEVRIVLEEERLPVHEELPRGPATALALGGGEDFELCVAAAEGRLDGLQAGFHERFGVPLTRVGRVEEGEGVAILRHGATSPEPLAGVGFDHFGGEG